MVLFQRLRLYQAVTPDLFEREKVRLTSLGRYHIYSLISIFQYLDATVISTPILDDTVRKQVTDVNNIHDRLTRTDLFIGYLDNCVSHLSDFELTSAWGEVSLKAKQNIEEVRKRIAKTES